MGHEERRGAGWAEQAEGGASEAEKLAVGVRDDLGSSQTRIIQRGAVHLVAGF